MEIYMDIDIDADMFQGVVCEYSRSCSRCNGVYFTGMSVLYDYTEGIKCFRSHCEKKYIQKY